jgi:hypothetical protein
MVPIKDRKKDGVYTDGYELWICVDPDLGGTDGLFVKIPPGRFSCEVDSSLWRDVMTLSSFFKGMPEAEFDDFERTFMISVFKAQKMIQKYK